MICSGFVRRKPPRDLRQHLVAGRMPEGPCDALELLNLDQADSHGSTRRRSPDQDLFEHGADCRTCRQAGQRMMIGLIGYGRLAIGYRMTHGVERTRESLELRRAGQRHRGTVVARLESFCRLRQILDGLGGAARQQHRKHRSDGQQQCADRKHGILQFVVRLQGTGQRSLQNQCQWSVCRADRIGPCQQLVGPCRDLEWRCFRRALDIDEWLALLPLHRAGDIRRVAVIARHEGHVDAQLPGHIGRDAIVESKSHGGPADRLGREHRRQHKLIRSSVDEPVQLQNLTVGIARNQRHQIIGGIDRQSAESAYHRMSVRCQHDDQIRVDAAALILNRRQQSWRVGRRHRFFEAEILGQCLDCDRQSGAAKPQNLAGGIGGSVQLITGLPFHLRARLDYNCDDCCR